MRDLRSSIRTATEPIIITNKVIEVSNGISQSVDDKTFNVFGNVMAQKENTSNGANGGVVTNDAIKVTLYNMDKGIDIQPNSSTLTIRNKVYIVTGSDEYGINTETKTLYARIKNG